MSINSIDRLCFVVDNLLLQNFLFFIYLFIYLFIYCHPSFSVIDNLINLVIHGSLHCL